MSDLEDENSSLEDENSLLSSNLDQANQNIEEMNSAIEDAKWNAWGTYDDMGNVLDDLQEGEVVY